LKRAEALEKFPARFTTRLDQCRQIGHLRRSAHNRLRHASVCRQRRNRTLQPFDRLADAAVHAAVENDVIETGRQIIAANGIPILCAVDLIPLGRRHQIDVLKRQAFAFAIGVVVDMGDAPIRPSAGIVRIVRLATLVNKHKRQRLREICGRHCNTPTQLPVLYHKLREAWAKTRLRRTRPCRQWRAHPRAAGVSPSI